LFSVSPRWSSYTEAHFDSFADALARNITGMSRWNFISELKNILITFVAARAVINGEITHIIGFVQSLQDAQISLDRLVEIHARDDEEDRHENKLTVLILDRDCKQMMQSDSF
jgi:ATP-binding cassette subfamily B protein